MLASAASVLLATSSALQTPAAGHITRRGVLLAACASGATRPRAAHADGLSADFAGPPNFEQFAEQQQRRARENPDAEAARARLADPYAPARAANPNRNPGFVDELPPMDPAERRRAQQEAAAERFSSENVARPAPKVSKYLPAPQLGARRLDDEYVVEFDSAKPLGLKLRDLRVGFEYSTTEGTSRVLVSDVAAGGQAALSGKVSIDDIVVAVDGANVETESAKLVQERIAKAKAAGRPVALTFKDSLSFNEKLATGARRASTAPISTKIAPGTATQAEQVLSVQRLEVPDRCTRNAQSGDLIEIRYTGRLEDGTVFDGMELADRFGDDSIQFVLGKQPAGQFPPSWDVGLVGMCVGERRVLDVPPVLGYGAKGLPKRGVPPDARLTYDVELLAINALSTP